MPLAGITQEGVASDPITPEIPVMAVEALVQGFLRVSPVMG
jgi:hypothetical protein